MTEPSGRLYQALVTTKKASSVSGVALLHDPGVIEFSAELSIPSQSLDAVRNTMIDVLEKLDGEDHRGGSDARRRFKRDPIC